MIKRDSHFNWSRFYILKLKAKVQYTTESLGSSSFLEVGRKRYPKEKEILWIGSHFSFEMHRL